MLNFFQKTFFVKAVLADFANFEAQIAAVPRMLYFHCAAKTGQPRITAC
jgi:hypothetical protein